MNFSLTEEQEAVRDLADQIFEGQATVERIKAVEAGDDRIDHDLWAELARANLLGLAIPEEAGGSGLGLIELCVLLEAQGRRVAPVPLLPTLVMGALAVAEFGTPAQRAELLPGVASGEIMLTAALEGRGATVAPDGTLEGQLVSVPAAHVAARMLVPADGKLFLIDPRGPAVTLQRAETTNRSIVCHLTLEGTPAQPLAAPIEWVRQRALVAVAALQVGVAEGALRQAADYTSNRFQFGRPLSTFQGIAIKAADAYIDTEAMRVTMWQAAWRLSEGHDATAEVEVAKWWAAEGGQRVVHATQHLHGGLGADIEYPVHRHFLWGKQLEDTLGGATSHLAALGDHLAGAR